MNLIKWLNKNYYLYWIPLYCSILVITYFSLFTKPFTRIGLEAGDSILNFNILHIVAYFVLGTSMTIALTHSKHKSKYIILYSILFCFLFGTLMEIIQYFIPGRFFSIIDISQNLAGIVIGQMPFFIKKIYL